MRDHTNFIATGMMILGALMILVAATSANAHCVDLAAEHALSLLVDPAPRQKSICANGL